MSNQWVYENDTTDSRDIDLDPFRHHNALIRIRKCGGTFYLPPFARDGDRLDGSVYDVDSKWKMPGHPRNAHKNWSGWSVSFQWEDWEGLSSLDTTIKTLINYPTYDYKKGRFSTVGVAPHGGFYPRVCGNVYGSSQSHSSKVNAAADHRHGIKFAKGKAEMFDIATLTFYHTVPCSLVEVYTGTSDWSHSNRYFGIWIVRAFGADGRFIEWVDVPTNH